jgi:hypothetical protein
MNGEAITLEYDPPDNIVYIDAVAKVELTTHEEIVGHFARIARFWRARAGGKKSYFVVNMANITISVAALEFYADHLRRSYDVAAIIAVRYGGGPLERTAARLGGMKSHSPSNVYATREEALEVVRAHQRGELKADGTAAAPNEPPPSAPTQKKR